MHTAWYVFNRSSISDKLNGCFALSPLTVCSLIRLLGSVVVYRRTNSNPDNTCVNERELETYLILTVVALAFEIAVELAIAWISLQGTVADDRPRRHMDKAVYAHSALIVLEVVTQAYGFRLIWGANPLTCPSSTHTTLIVHLLVYISTAGLILYGIIVLLLFLRSTPLNVDSIDHAAVWHSRLSWLFFSHRRKQNLGGDSGDGDILADVARVFAEFLRDAQTVPSDILVGIVLLRRKQKREMSMGMHGEVNEDPNDPPCVNDAGGVELTEDHQAPPPRSRHAISDFYQYAMSIYGLPLYMLNNFGRGLFHLLCPCTRTPPETAVAAVQTNTAPSFVACFFCFASSQPKEIADQMLPHADIVHVSLRGGLFRSPFVVCFDHPRRTIVIAVRGTLSTADVLVDLNCDLTEIQLPGGLTAHTHSGMFRTARNLLSELSTTGALRRVLLDPASQYATYSILTTGHSLGGGVASLLAFLLADLFPDHSTTCIAYSPPGCMITAPAIPHFRRFCTSVVMGLDVVPRLNRNTLETLKRAVDEEVRTCNVHKLKVLGG
ncbi:Alpha/Beta hydrolase protein, partial [Geranomyces variabilis]